MTLQSFTSMRPPWPVPDPGQWHELAATLSLDPEPLSELLWQINAPASLQGLQQALAALPTVLTSARDLALLDREQLRDWLGYLGELSARLEARLPTAAVSKKFPLITRQSVRYLCELHPYYAVLVVARYLSPTAPDLAPLLVRCWVAAVGQYASLRPDQHEVIGRALRSLYDRRGPCPDLRLTGTPAMDDEALAQALERAVPEGSRGNRAYVEVLARLLRENLAPSRRQGGGSGGGGGGVIRGGMRLQLVEVLDEGGDDPETPAGESPPSGCLSVDLRTRRPGGMAYETEARGLAPGDAGDTQTYASMPLERTRRLAETLDPLCQRVDKATIAAEIAMRAQNLGYRWDLLTPSELGVFFSEVDRLLQPASADDQDDARHLALLLMTMLSRGLDPAQALTCRVLVLGADDPEPVVTQDTLVARWHDPRLPGTAGAAMTADWRWYTCPRLVTGGAPIQPELVRPTREVLCLPLPPPFASFFALALGPDGSAPGASRPLIRRSRQVLARLAGGRRPTRVNGAAAPPSWCSHVNRRYGTRLTTQRISRYFQRRALARGDLDAVSVATIRGQADASAATQAYYQAVEPELLAAQQWAFWRQILAETLPEMAVDAVPAWLRVPWPAQPALALPGVAAGIGSRRVPTTEAVRRVVRWLQDGIEATRGRGDGWAAVVAAHNAYVLYSMHYLLWALGARALHEPLADPRLVDPGSNLVALCDKSAADGYSTRLIYAPDDFIDHLHKFHAHWELLAVQLALRKPAEHARYVASQRAWTARIRADASAERLPTLFVVFNPHQQLDALTSEAATIARMPQALRLAPNSARHYLRTYLIERGCPEALIDAQLGHVQHGREPWGISSSLAPLDFARYMRRYLNDLPRDLGFVPIPSPLVRGRR